MRLLGLGVERGLVESREHLPPDDVIVEVDLDAGDPPRDLRTHGDGLAGLQVPGRADLVDQSSARGRFAAVPLGLEDRLRTHRHGDSRPSGEDDERQRPAQDGSSST
ncbi:hypothetical protein OV079_50445 [Nannocystis pusilla]|uniref:Uncharacterized protein n=1 Tax=Nannocystis pusilla TaxID=889268 RepID=A0A9X3J4Z6_9BACT|nr:hypothetical protein [Nannocystis pusilla]MCY1013618.1 hypothetical protein [Nannocystis pusilla]